MGSGKWSTNVYEAATRFRRRTNASPFGHSDGGATNVHHHLDPYGVGLRESRDSLEHPESLPIAVLFDVTGSMDTVPRTLQGKLPELLGLILRKGYAGHPQIMFGAIGDATCDRAPLQVGQFESDNRMDEDLGKILLEGGGGGTMSESYELAMYFMARHTALDCYEKRGRRGYLFMIGDEMAYRRVTAREVRTFVGDELAENLDTADLVTELRQMYDVYFIIPQGAFHSRNRQVLRSWQELLGQNVLHLDDLGAVCETIALTVGMAEGAIRLDEGLDHLREFGSTAGPSVSRALARLDSGLAPVVTSTTLPTSAVFPTGLDIDAAGEITRL
jgi:hypothetical protein